MIRCENRVHFLALCSQIIRRILVDHARSRGYAKRGANTECVPLDESIVGGFGALSVEETAEALGITAVRVKRDWKSAKTWLYGVMTAEGSHAPRTGIQEG